jgi:hypothetical protein
MRYVCYLTTLIIAKFLECGWLVNQISVEQWWNDTDWGKPKFSERNLPQCYFVRYKSHTVWLGIERDKPPEPRHDQNVRKVRVSGRTSSFDVRGVA